MTTSGPRKNSCTVIADNCVVNWESESFYPNGSDQVQDSGEWRASCRPLPHRPHPRRRRPYEAHSLEEQVPAARVAYCQPQPVSSCVDHQRGELHQTGTMRNVSLPNLFSVQRGIYQRNVISYQVHESARAS